MYRLPAVIVLWAAIVLGPLDHQLQLLAGIAVLFFQRLERTLCRLDIFGLATNPRIRLIQRFTQYTDLALGAVMLIAELLASLAKLLALPGQLFDGFLLCRQLLARAFNTDFSVAILAFAPQGPAECGASGNAAKHDCDRSRCHSRTFPCVGYV